MGGGGKTAQTSSQVTIPPEVLARYNSVNATAEKAAQEPFQQYSQDPNAFVAPINQQQQAGIQSVNNAASAWQPYFQAATDAANSSVTGAMPWMGAAGQTINNANAHGQYQTQAAYNPLFQGQQDATGLNAAAGNAYGSSYASSQPFMGQAAGLIGQGYSGAQPYNMGATGLALQGGQAVNPSQLNSQAINQYMNPYLSSVMAGTLNPMIQQQQQQMSAMQGNQIMQGAFGGDRANIGQAVLGQQQNLALGQMAAGIQTDAYNSALNTAGQQQQLGLSAEQANRAATQSTADRLAGLGQQVYGQGVGAGQAYAGLGQAQFGMGQQYGQSLQGLGSQVYGQGAQTSQQQAALAQQLYGMGANTSQIQQALGQSIYGIGSGYSGQLAGLGQGAQAAGLAGGQAQLGAGTLEQQTQQAGLTALYNQFQQQQGYPFQVAQFLANIAEGTGALSGSTTTSTSPASSFLSDERAKEDIEPIGKTFDGQNIIKFRYKGHPGKQIGLSAQETEHHHPRAVGLDASGLKTVDYDEATKGAAARGHFYEGGLVAAGGAVNDNNAYERYAVGGMPGFDMNSILQSQMGMYAPQGGAVPGLGGAGGYGAGIAGTPSTHTLKTVDAPKYKAPTLKDAADTLESGEKIYEGGKKAYGKIDEMINGPANQYDGSSGTPMDFEGDLNPRDFDDGLGADNFDDHEHWARGGLVPHKAEGGEIASDVSTNYPLSDTYANYMAQQRMHPFSGMGIYGNPLITTGVGGPYSTMLEGRDTNRHLLNSPAPEAHKYENKDASEDSYQRLVKMTGAKGKKKEEDKPEGHASGGRSNFDVGGYVTNPGGYVPQPMENKQQELASADPVKAPKDSTMSDIADVAKIAMMFVNRGGRIKRAAGGLNMSMPGNMGYVPEQTQPTPELLQASAPKGAGGDDSLTQAIGIASKFLANGGRAGYEEGGEIGFFDRLFPRAQPPHTYDVEPTKARYVMGSDPVAEAALAAPTRTEGLSAPRPAPTPTPTPRPGLPEDILATPHQVEAPAVGNVAPGLNLPATAPTLPARGLGQRISDAASDVGDTISSGYNAVKGLDARQGHIPGATPQRGNESDFLSRNQDWMVPLIKGIGAASLYPGKSVIGASLYGLSKGAESYEDTQNQLAERQQTTVDTAQQQAKTPFINPDFVTLADGSRITKAQYYALAAQGKAPAVQGEGNLPYSTPVSPAAGGQGSMAAQSVKTGAPPAPTAKKWLGTAGSGIVNSDYNTSMSMAPEVWRTLPQYEESKKEEARVNAAATAAYQQGGVINQLTDALMRMPDKGVASGGMFNSYFAPAANAVNDVIRKIGAGDQFLIDTKGLDANVAAQKLSAVLQFAQAHGADQNSLGALQAASAMIPGVGYSKDQAAMVLSGLYRDKQSVLDQQNYLNEAKGEIASQHPGMNDRYLAQNISNAFRTDHPDTEYGKAKDAIHDLLLRKNAQGESAFSQIYAGKWTPEVIDKYGEAHYGVKNLSRFITNR